MFSPIKNLNSGEEPLAFPISALPNELVIEILTWLPGKQIGRCKCVSKPWRAMIGSRSFMEIYRKRQRGVLLHWADEIDRDGVPFRRIRFFHCPLRRLEEPREEFSVLREWECGPIPKGSAELVTFHGHRFLLGATQLVNGLICIREAEFSDSSGVNNSTIESMFTGVNNLTVHSICTGDMMRVPDPIPCVDTDSTFHLGYDPASKLYKLLRLIFSKKGAFLIQAAHIMTLQPPSRSLSTWRELDSSECDLHLVGTSDIFELIISTVDGILCWKRTSLTKILCFDLNTERFQLIEYSGPEMMLGAVTRFKDNLAMWTLDRSGLYCCVQDNEGKNRRGGRKYLMKVLKDFMKSGGFKSGSRLSFSGSLSFSTTGELLVRKPDQTWRVYPYTRQQTQHGDKDDVFVVGKHPEGAPHLRLFSQSHCWYQCLKYSYGFGQSCFMEGNNMYLPLDDVLGGGTGIM